MGLRSPDTPLVAPLKRAFPLSGGRVAACRDPLEVCVSQHRLLPGRGPPSLMRRRVKTGGFSAQASERCESSGFQSAGEPRGGTDGAPDYNRHLARNTPYADWHPDWEGPRTYREANPSTGMLGSAAVVSDTECGLADDQRRERLINEHTSLFGAVFQRRAVVSN